MPTFLRPLSYKYQWLYDNISRLGALTVGGEKRFRTLALEGLSLNKTTQILDLCCGAGQTTKFLLNYSSNVIGLDASPVALGRAAQQVPQAKYIQGFAQKIPLEDCRFDLVHTSVALHEMTPIELTLIFQEVYRVLKPGGIFAFIDLHRPTNFLFWPPLALFMWLFETHTAWQLLATEIPQELKAAGFTLFSHKLYAGGSLQVIQAKKKGEPSPTFD